MLRLVHFANYPNRHAGSFIPMVSAVFDAAIARGWRVDAFFTAFDGDAEWAQELEDRGVGLRFISPGTHRQDALRVTEILAASGLPTIIHTHFTTYDVPAALAARRRGNCALFWHIHTFLAAGAIARLRNSLKLGTVGRWVDGILVPADNVGAELIRRLAPRERIVLFPSPIDADAFQPPSAALRLSARRDLGIPDGSFALLHIGRAWELKGGDIYLRAVRKLLDGGLPLVAVTLRGGEQASTEVRRLGLGEHVRVLERVEDITALYAAVDCFVAPSRGEGMPFSIVEALASGIPVVASDHLPGHLYLSDRVGACVTVPANPEAIAIAVRQMLERTPDQVAKQASAAREWIASDLNLDAAAERMLDLYQRAAADRGLL